VRVAIAELVPALAEKFRSAAGEAPD
jgi:hypothetical protein